MTDLEVLDISRWTKWHIDGVAYVGIEGHGLVPVSLLMKYYKVVDYKMRGEERTNPSGIPDP